MNIVARRVLRKSRSGEFKGALGIHIGLSALYVAEVYRGHVERWGIRTYPEGVEPGVPAFADFLQKQLQPFWNPRHLPVWLVGPIPSLQVRFLAMPKVRAGQISNLVYWTFRKEIPFDAAQTIFDYDVEGETNPTGQGRKIEATAYTALRSDVNSLTGLFEQIGIPLNGILIPSFAIRNLFRGPLNVEGGGISLALFTGADESALLFFKERQVVSHRVFKTGMNIMLDAVRELNPSCTTAEALLLMRAAEENSAGSPTAFPSPSSPEQIREALQIPFTRLVQQVERSISAYLGGKTGEEIQNLYVAGPLAELSYWGKEMGARLGLTSQPLNLFKPPLVEAGAATMSTPEEGGALAIALGAALSDNQQTPNLLYTYIKREQHRRMKRIKRGIVLGTLVLLAAVIVVHLFSGRFIRHTLREYQQYQAKINQYVPYPDRAMIENMVRQAIANNVQLKTMVNRHLMAVVLGVLARETPEDIRMISIAIERVQPTPSEVVAAKRRGKSAEQEKSVEMKVQLEGIVRGEAGSQRSKLAAYQMRLEASELLEQVTLTQADEGRSGRDPVLLFALEMKVETPKAAGTDAASALGGKR